MIRISIRNMFHKYGNCIEDWCKHASLKDCFVHFCNNTPPDHVLPDIRDNIVCPYCNNKLPAIIQLHSKLFP